MKTLLALILCLFPALGQPLTLAWTPNTPTSDAGTNATGYKIHQGVASHTYSSTYDAGVKTTFVVPDANIPPGKDYYFAVTAYNAAGGESPYSNEVLYIVSPSPTPSPSSSPTPTPTATPSPTPTPTPTPTPAFFTIGNTSVFTIPDYGNGSLLLGQKVTCSKPGTLTSLSFYVTTPGGSLILGLYSGSSAPATLLAQTASFTPKTGWNTAAVITPKSLSAGTYWLAYLPSSNTLGFVKALVSGGCVWTPRSYGALPSTFPTPAGGDGYQWSFYATLSASGTPTPSPTPSATPTPTPTPTATPTPTPSPVLYVYTKWIATMNTYIAGNNPTPTQLLAWINAHPPVSN